MRKTTFLFLVLILSIVMVSQTLSSCSDNSKTVANASNLPIEEVEAVIISPSNFIIKDAQYSAEIIVGVKKSSIEPKIYLTYDYPFYELYEEEGETKYRLLQDADYEEISVGDDGKGLYTADCLAAGDFMYGGLIHYELESGDLWLPFESNYVVGYSGFIATGPDAYVIYRGVENVVNISVSGYPQEMLDVSINHGSISSLGRGEYKVVVEGDFDKVEVEISINTGEGKKEIGKQEFVIREK